MVVISAVLTGVAVLLCRPPELWVVRRRLSRGAADRRVPGPAVLAAFVVAGLWLALRSGLSGPRVGVAVTVAAVAAFAVRQWRRAREARRWRERRRSVAEAIGLMSAELRAGILPQRVLTGLASEFDFLSSAARAAELGGDVPAALRAAGHESGAGLLDGLAAAWLVAERAGAPLAHVLDRLEDTARGDLETEREVAAGIAPARATGRLMAVLPVLGLGLGSGMGGDPVEILTGTWPGVACLAAGCGLACAGVAWVERIAAGAGEES